MIKLSDIKKNPRNPRIIRDAQFLKLKKSVAEFPRMLELRPIVLDEANMVIAGNMRLEALKANNYKEIPEEWIKRAEDFTPEELRRFIITDNTHFGEHDWEMIANEWDAEPLDEWGLEVPMMTEPPEEISGESDSNTKGIPTLSLPKRREQAIYHLSQLAVCLPSEE